MAKAIAAANYLLLIATNAAGEGVNAPTIPAMTPMKLQKLVFYAHGWFLGTHGAQLIDDEQVEAWNWGPVFPSLYHASKRFGTRSVEGQLAIEDWSRGPVFDGPNYSPSIETEFQHPGAIREQLDQTFRLYRGYSASQLSNSTHMKGTPWYQVYCQLHNGNPPRGTDIEPARIQRFFAQWSQTGRPPENLPIEIPPAPAQEAQ